MGGNDFNSSKNNRHVDGLYMKYPTQLEKMSFDEMLDFTADVFFHFITIPRTRSVVGKKKTTFSVKTQNHKGKHDLHTRTYIRRIADPHLMMI